MLRFEVIIENLNICYIITETKVIECSIVDLANKIEIILDERRYGE